MAKVKWMPPGTFMKQFTAEKQCREYPASVRWKSGFVCPQCAPLRRDRKYTLKGTVELDDTYFGGPTREKARPLRPFRWMSMETRVI